MARFARDARTCGLSVIERYALGPGCVPMALRAAVRERESRDAALSLARGRAQRVRDSVTLARPTQLSRDGLDRHRHAAFETRVSDARPELTVSCRASSFVGATFRRGRA